jgi:hypothetical protein
MNKESVKEADIMRICFKRIKQKLAKKWVIFGDMHL